METIPGVSCCCFSPLAAECLCLAAAKGRLNPAPQHTAVPWTAPAGVKGPVQQSVIPSTMTPKSQTNYFNRTPQDTSKLLFAPF